MSDRKPLAYAVFVPPGKHRESGYVIFPDRLEAVDFADGLELDEIIPLFSGEPERIDTQWPTTA